MLRSARDGLNDIVSDETRTEIFGETRTTQSSKDECDINVIVRNFGITGSANGPARLPTYGDFNGINDYQSAMNAVRAAQESFNALPSEVRARFRNDPQAFVEFASDPANFDQLREMGLAKKLPKDDTPAVTERDVVRRKLNRKERINARRDASGAGGSESEVEASDGDVGED